MSKPARLDTELVRRGLARSRAEAKRMIETGQVLVRGLPADRPTTMVTSDDSVAVASPGPRFVSRGGEKLDGALARLDVPVEGRHWLDVGASTGGFTDRLLQGGATSVTAVDVGYGQLDWKLRQDRRVRVLDRTNARDLRREDLEEPVTGVTADLSFISLTVVLPALVAAVEPEADHLLMVKPQFEVGKGVVGKGGVVRDPVLWREAVTKVVDRADSLGLVLVGAAASPLPGPAGNREFFVHLRAGATHDPSAIDRAIAEI